MEYNLSGPTAKLLYVQTDGLPVKELISVNFLVQRNVGGTTINDENCRLSSPIWFTLQEPESPLLVGLSIE